MNYTPQEVDGSVLQSLFPEFPMTFAKLPELPMLEAKCGKWKMKVPNLAILNEDAVSVFTNIVNTVAKHNDVKEVKFIIPDSDEFENKIRLIIDINMAIGFQAKKRGTSMSGSFLVNGVHYETADNGQRKVVFGLIDDHADAIYTYAQHVLAEKGKLELDLFDMCVAIAETVEKQFQQPPLS